MPDRQRLYRTEAIVLRRSDLGEADRLLTLLTPERGKLRVIAKGARKIASRKSGHVELFNRVNFLVARGRGEFDIISQAETIEPFRALREDLLRSTYAHYAAELLDRFAEEGTPQPELFDLLADALGWLAHSPNLALTARYFELRLLTLTGFQPQVFHCVAGGEPLDEVQSDEMYGWSPGEGGALCPRHALGRTDIGRLSLGALKVLRHAMRNDYHAFSALQVRESVAAEIERALQRYLTYVLERKVKSIEFINLLRRESVGSSQ
ncbi:MAG TPA: DNA repair protein RecO [Anaerolineae bacterium]|nr:DNA repair protein RecO [Anaerolineae bacterium]